MRPATESAKRWTNWRRLLKNTKKKPETCSLSSSGDSMTYSQGPSCSPRSEQDLRPSSPLSAKKLLQEMDFLADKVAGVETTPIPNLDQSLRTRMIGAFDKRKQALAMLEDATDWADRAVTRMRESRDAYDRAQNEFERVAQEALKAGDRMKPHHFTIPPRPEKLKK